MKFNLYPTVSSISPNDTFLIWQNSTGLVKQIAKGSLGTIGSVATIALLRAFSVATISNGDVLIVNGYLSSGDGGGGQFYYSLASVAGDNGGTIIQPTTGAGRWLRLIPVPNELSVSWFGAVGDGVTNDRAAIQAAIDTLPAGGGSVVFGAKTYLVSTGLNVGGSGVKLVGQGYGSTIIMAPHASNFNILTIAGTGATPGNISTYSGLNEVTGIQFYRALSGLTGSANNSAGIRVQYTIFCRLTDVYISCCGTGLYLLGTVDLLANRVRINSSYVSAVNGYGVYIDGTYQNASCYLNEVNVGTGGFAGTTSYGYHVDGTNISDIYMSRCEGNGSNYGFYFNASTTSGAYGAVDIHLSECVADQVSTAGFYFTGFPDNAANVQMTGCYAAINTTTGYCAAVVSSSGVSIAAMQCISVSTGTGILVQNSSNCSFTRSIIKGPFSSGFLVTSSSNCTFSGNVVQATASTASSQAFGVVNSPRNTFMGNIVSAITAQVWRYGFFVNDLTSADCSVIGNQLVSTGIFASSQLVFNAGTDATWNVIGNKGINSSIADAVVLASTIKLKSYAVASLPSAATAGAGATAYATNLTSIVSGSTATGGGALLHVVTSDGTNWIVQ